MDTAQTPNGRGTLLAMIGCLYLVQGLPVGLAFQAYPVLLRDGGASLNMISLVPLASLPWVLKIAWASLVENRWSRRLGRSRSWILPMQSVLAFSIGGMAFLPFTAENAPALLVLVGVASLAGATQDIATDGLASERLCGAGLVHINTFQVAGFMVGMLAGGPGVMVGIGVAGHTAALLTLAVLVVVCGVPVAVWREPGPPHGTASAPASLAAFGRRPGALRMLALGSVATLGGAVTFGLAKLILVDAGWSLDAVGFLSGAGSSLMILAGCGVAALMLPRAGVGNTLILGSALVVASAVVWAVAARDPAAITPGLAWPLAGGGGIGIGVVTVASYTALMRFARSGTQPGTDFSIFQGIQTLGEILVSSLATAIAAGAGYPAALSMAVAAAVAAAVMTVWMRRTPAAGLLAEGGG